MSDQSLLVAAFLGILEGLTEFIPVSSTGHILLAGHFLGFHSTGKTFEVLIQLGAILAILLVYFRRLLDIALRIPHDPSARRFVLGVLVAFLPAAVIGALAHDFIKTVLFETPMLICIVLIVGGVILSWVADRPVPIVPLMVSKANTAAQIVYVTLALSVAWLGWQLGWAVDITAIVVAVLTVVSAAAYLRGWLRDMQG